MATFVVTDGQLAALERPAGISLSSVRVTDKLTVSYADIYRTQPHVRTVVSFLARNIAQIGIHVFDRVSDTDRKRLTDHPLARLLARPNARTTRYRLMDSLINDLGIWDNAFWVKAKGGSDTPHGLIRLPPALVTPLGDSWMWADKFRLKGSGGTRDFDASEVVHFRGYNPGDARWGLSPMETLRQVLAEEYEAGQWRQQLWRNGARFPGHIRRPANTPWTDTQRERFVTSWRGLYTGDGPAAGGTPILEDGMTFEASGVTPQQAQYLETRKLTREEVAAAFHIPLPMVGILDHATFSNIKEQHQQLYQDTLGPWLQMISEDIGLQLLPDLDTSGTVYVEFNLAEKMKGSFEEQSQQLQTAVGGPWLTRNEARARQNLPEIDGGDQLIVPLNLGAPAGADVEMSAEDLRSRIDSAAALIRSGFDPTASIIAVGLDPIKHLGLLPVTVQKPAEPENVDESLQEEIAKARGALVKSAMARKSRVSDDDQEQLAKALRSFFQVQRRAVLGALGSKAAGDWWDGEKWDADLAAVLYAQALQVATKLGRAAAESLGFEAGDYDPERTQAFLQAVAASRASMINTATREQVKAALESEDEDATPDRVFDLASTSRAETIGLTLATTFGSFAAVEAGRQVAPDQATKTWRTGSLNPRKAHARMSGETVGIDEKFSNGADWPGDPSLGADGVSGCKCDVEISIP